MKFLKKNKVLIIFIIILLLTLIYTSLNTFLSNDVLLYMFLFTIGNEIHIYKEIGNIHHKRLERIEECKESNCNILTLEKMPKKYSKYHIDSNSPSNNLPKDINIKLEVEK